jgi:molecular chaperone HtpG
MNSSTEQQQSDNVNPIPFKAETRQILDILIHSLYTDQEIFLRELISNASDALARMNFEMLTNRDILDPDTALEIRINPNSDDNTLIISDTGIGMTAEELVENLGTIAHSGAKAFVTASQAENVDLSEIIGQFGVGFYSAFMVADWIKVVSRSYRPDSDAAIWYCTGSDTYTIESAEKTKRGTDVILKLKDDISEFTQQGRLREIIRRHSDFIPFPIYIGDQEDQINRQTTLWRQQPRDVSEEEYYDFYKQLTLDFENPFEYTHLNIDAPVQLYSILYIPAKFESNIFSLRKDTGLKLFSRKVLIQEYCKDLLPQYLRFIQGVVDSEDLPLNVSRESVQSNRIMVNLKKIITSKAINLIETMASDEPDDYIRFWEEFRLLIKEGIATEQEDFEPLYPLLRFHTTKHIDEWSSLENYLERRISDQNEIYYLLADDESSAFHSPHLDIFRKLDLEVILFTDTVDPFVMIRMDKYKDHPLTNVASPDIKLPDIDREDQEGEVSSSIPADDWITIIERFKSELGDRVSDVRITDRLSDSPARLVDPQEAPDLEIQRVYQYLQEDIQLPKKVMELNPRHPILIGLNELSAEDELSSLIILQLYEDSLLSEGSHPDPASMVYNIQKLMEEVLKK